MLFNSIHYALFLPFVFFIYWTIPHKWRWILLLSTSYYFYMSWNVKYIFLIFITTIVTYTAAILLEKQSSVKYKKIILSGVAFICIGILFIFKYYNFFSETLLLFFNSISIHMHPLTLNLLLPVGISFYTFQTLSYVIDVYNKKINAERHLGLYATYISFFPQLVAGPIERTDHLLPQFKKHHIFSYEQITHGLKLMMWGYYKKIVIADTLSPYVSKIYNNPTDYSGFSLFIATIFFTIQIYCDFSGYSDIAIGTSELLGIQLVKNFKSPYFSESIKEFWSRWHISLSSWFRDYVYIPLGGNRTSPIRKCRNLMITFLVSGLWHGADWTFVVWGGLHGFAQIIENHILKLQTHKSRSNKRIHFINIFFVFTFVTFAWIFFVSNSLTDAIYVISHMFDNIISPIIYLRNGFSDLDINKIELLKISIFIFILFIYDYNDLHADVINEISAKSVITRWAIYISLLLVIILFSPKGIPTEFVYFQF